VRRFILAVTVVYFKKYRTLQLLILLWQSTIMMVIQASFKPYVERRKAIMEMFNEFMILLSVLHVHGIADMVPETEAKKQICYSLVCVMGLQTLFSFGAMM